MGVQIKNWKLIYKNLDRAEASEGCSVIKTWQMLNKGVFRTQLKICDDAFLENS